jgi:hypothetical protein
MFARLASVTAAAWAGDRNDPIFIPLSRPILLICGNDAEWPDQWDLAHRTHALCVALQRQSGIHWAASEHAFWATAAAPALGITESEIAQALQPPSPPLLQPILDFLVTQPGQQWTGTTSSLFDALPPEVRPPNTNELGNCLKRMKPALEAAGIVSPTDTPMAVPASR